MPDFFRAVGEDLVQVANDLTYGFSTALPSSVKSGPPKNFNFGS